MNQYMVDFFLPPVLSQEFIATIPEHRARVNELMRKGKIISYTLALDRSKLWAIIRAGSEEEVEALIETLPLSPYMEAEIYELFFHNSLSNELPLISLN